MGGTFKTVKSNPQVRQSSINDMQTKKVSKSPSAEKANSPSRFKNIDQQENESSQNDFISKFSKMFSQQVGAPSANQEVWNNSLKDSPNFDRNEQICLKNPAKLSEKLLDPNAENKDLNLSMTIPSGKFGTTSMHSQQTGTSIVKQTVSKK